MVATECGFSNALVWNILFIGFSIHIDGNVFVVTRKEPVGVAGQIIPWVSRFVSSCSINRW